MAQKNLNTSRAVSANIDIFNYDKLPLSLTYETEEAVPVPIDLTNFRFDFILEDQNKNDVLAYAIESGVTSNTYLQKTGASVNTLDMQGMWEHLRDRITPETAYRFLQIVTTPTNFKYVQIIYIVNAGRY